MPKKIKKLFFLIPITIIFLGLLWYFIPTLPKERPSGVVFTCSYVVSPEEYYTVSLSEYGGQKTIYKNDSEKVLEFTVPISELDRIYTLMRERKIDKIITYKKRVYDRGGRSISVSWPGKFILKSHSGQSFAVFPKHRSAIGEIELAMENIANLYSDE